MSEKQNWFRALVKKEAITNTRSLPKELIESWHYNYMDYFNVNISEESFKRLLRKARRSEELIQELPVDDPISTVQTGVGNILVVGDLHEPFAREYYLEFCKSIHKKHECKTVVFIGDIADNHYSSFHESDPDADFTAGKELERLRTKIRLWHEAFPNSFVCNGNHDLIPQRKLFSAGLSNQWLRPMSDVLETPSWHYSTEFILNNVYFTHGTGRKARARMKQDLISIVQGHYHSESYIEYLVGRTFKLFSMQIGCGIDDKKYAFAYGRNFAKSHINVGVIKDEGNLPIIEYMDLEKKY